MNRQSQPNLINQLCIGDRPAVLEQQPLNHGCLVRLVAAAKRRNNLLNIHPTTVGRCQTGQLQSTPISGTYGENDGE